MSIDDIKKQVNARVHEEEALAPAVNREPLPESFVMECLRANRVGDARLYNTLHRGRFVFVKRWGRWLKWAGHHWAEDIMGEVWAAVEAVCEEYLRIAASVNEEIKTAEGKEKKGLEAKRESLLKRVNLLRDTGGRDRLLECAHTIAEPLAITGDELDQQPYILAFSNCVVDLRTGASRPGRPEDYILNASPVEWQGLEAEAPTWKKYLLDCHELCPDGPRAMSDFLRRALGYGALGDIRDHVFLVFWGDKGRNGKDVFAKVISAALGNQLASTIPVEMLLTSNQQRNSAGPSPDMMMLRGLRVAIANEPDKTSQFAMGKLKQLTGGSTLTARGLQDKLMTTWSPTHLLVLMTNDVPGARSEDTAFWSRMLVIHWRMRFMENPLEEDERKADKDLESKLRKELPGIAAWLVRGCLEYLEGGLRPPPSVLKDTRDKRDENDDVGRFLSEGCEFEDVQSGQEPTWRIPAGDLYDAFCVWLRNWRFGSKNFFQALGKKGIAKKKSGSIVYLGLQLTSEMQEDLERHRRGKKDADKDESKGTKGKNLFA